MLRLKPVLSESRLFFRFTTYTFWPFLYSFFWKHDYYFFLLIIDVYLQDSSLPCAVFVFTAINVSKEKRDVSISFTWTEVLGGSHKKKALG